MQFVKLWKYQTIHQTTWLLYSDVQGYLIRKDIADATKEPWKFAGTFNDTESHVPQRVFSFLRWLIVGPTGKLQNKSRECEVHQQLLWIANFIMYSFKTDRQARYNPLAEVAHFKTRPGWPLQWAVGIALHQSTRSKQLVDLLHGFGLCVNYPEMLKMENQLANSVTARMTEDHMYMPPPTTYGWIQEGHSYSPVPSFQPSAPKSIVELVKCGCVKSQCTSRCSCKQNDMFCTEMCQCGADAGDCQNIVDYRGMATGDSSDDDDD